MKIGKTKQSTFSQLRDLQSRWKRMARWFSKRPSIAATAVWKILLCGLSACGLLVRGLRACVLPFGHAMSHFHFLTDWLLIGPCKGGVQRFWIHIKFSNWEIRIKKGLYTGLRFLHFPAGTLRYIYVVFMFGGYVEITFDFMLECLVFLT